MARTGSEDRQKVTASPNRVKNQIIRAGLYKKKKTKTGKDFYSTRGQTIKARKGDKTVTNKKGEKVVVRKSGNRVVAKASGVVVRRKANGDRVITKKEIPQRKVSKSPTPKPVFVNPFRSGIGIGDDKITAGGSRDVLKKYNEELVRTGGTRGR